MMTNWGSVPANSVLPYFFHTFNSTGASVTISSFAIGDVLIYKGTSMTQRSSTAGIVLLDTDGIDLDGTTGIQGFSIDLSDNTDAGFYAVGSFYSVVVGPITVNANTVNFVAGTFRIAPAENTAGYQVVDCGKWNNLATVELPLVPTTAGRKLDVSAGGEAGVDWANVGSPTTALALTGTTIAVTQKVDVDTIKTNPVVNGGTITFPTTATLASTTNITAGTIATVSGNVNGNVGGSVASVTGLTASNLDASISSVKSKTDLIPGTQDGKTFAQTLLLIAATLLGKASGLGTATAVFRALDDSKDRVTTTVDASGNRTATTLDAS